MARQRPYPCPTCDRGKWSDGPLPCRLCSGVGSRAPRPCEVCSATYTPTHSTQRACGRACGVELWRQARPSKKPRPSVQRSCPVCEAALSARERLCSGCRLAKAAALKSPKMYVYPCVDCCAAAPRLCGPGPRPKRCEPCGARYRQAVRRAGRGEKTHAARARKYGGRIETVSRTAVYERDGWTCQLCGDPVNPDRKWPDQMCPSLDHITPLSAGGDHTMDNVRLAHWLCNSLRGVDEIDFRIPA